MAVITKTPIINRLLFALILCHFIIINLLPISVVADRSTGFGGSHWLDPDDYDHYIIEIGSGEGKMDYMFKVHNGPRLDIFLFDKDNYNDYVNGEPADYIEKGSSLDIYEVILSTDLEKGVYYLVIDNTFYGAAAPPSDEKGGVHYECDVEYSTFNNLLTYIDGTWMIVGVIFFITIIIMIIFLIKNKSKEY
jgi:hypothetical protein